MNIDRMIAKVDEWLAGGNMKEETKLCLGDFREILEAGRETEQLCSSVGLPEAPKPSTEFLKGGKG